MEPGNEAKPTCQRTTASRNFISVRNSAEIPILELEKTDMFSQVINVQVSHSYIQTQRTLTSGFLPQNTLNLSRADFRDWYVGLGDKRAAFLKTFIFV